MHFRVIEPSLWILRGRPFDSEGAGAGKFGRDRLFIFITGSAGKKLFPGKPRTEYLFSTATNFWKKIGGEVGGWANARV